MVKSGAVCADVPGEGSHGAFLNCVFHPSECWRVCRGDSVKYFSWKHKFDPQSPCKNDRRGGVGFQT